MLGDGDGVVQFDVTEFLYVDRVSPEDGVTTEDESVPAINIDTIVAAVGCHVCAVTTVPLGQGDIASGGAASQSPYPACQQAPFPQDARKRAQGKGHAARTMPSCSEVGGCDSEKKRELR